MNLSDEFPDFFRRHLSSTAVSTGPGPWANDYALSIMPVVVEGRRGEGWTIGCVRPPPTPPPFSRRLPWKREQCKCIEIERRGFASHFLVGVSDRFCCFVLFTFASFPPCNEFTPTSTKEFSWLKGNKRVGLIETDTLTDRQTKLERWKESYIHC